MHRETWGLFFTDRWVVAPWDEPPAAATWATKYQGPSERGAQNVAEIWNERRRRGLARQQQIRSKQRKPPRVSFRRENLPEVFRRDRGTGTVRPTRPTPDLSDAEHGAQRLIIPGIGPSRHGGPIVDIASGHAARHNPPGSNDSALATYGPPPTPGLFAAFTKAQGEFEKLAFNAKNEHFKNPYATLDAMLGAVRPALNKHGLAFIQHVRYDGRNVSVTSELWHSSGEVYHFDTLTGQTREQQPTPQQQAAAATYLKRQALSANLGIAGEIDDDANAACESEQTTAERGKDSPRTSKRKAASSKKPPDDSAAGLSSTGEPSSFGEPLIGTVCEIQEGQTSRGTPYWKFTLVHKDRPNVQFGTFDAKCGEKLADGEQVEVRWMWSKDGNYRNAVGIDVLPF